MIIIASISVAIAGIIMLFSTYLLIRSEWVYRRRMEILDYWAKLDIHIWIAMGKPTNDTFLPSFNEMMMKFWIWDLNKFLKRSLTLEEEYYQGQQVELRH